MGAAFSHTHDLSVTDPEFEEMEAICGSVCLEPCSIKYLGALILSNDTAELTALIEAMLRIRAKQHAVGTIRFCYDSK